jgi:hypothetical protein
MTASNMGYSQCGKNITITSSRTEYLDAKDSIQHTALENTIIEISKAAITIAPGDDPNRVMNGKISSMECNWKIPFSEGRSVIKAVFINRAGETKNATLTIEGKDGRIVFLLAAAENPEFRIKVLADKFEEKK